MHYYLYKITNLINNKIYIGVHRTQNLNDCYMGSGKRIRHAIKEHGVENFRRDILEHFDTQEAMYAREKEVVNEDFLSLDNVYNMVLGGHDGFKHMTHEQRVQVGRTAAKKSTHQQGSRQGGINASKINKELKIGIYAETYISPFVNKEHQKKGCKQAQSPEAILKRKNTRERLLHQQGSKNSQYGKMWITNGAETKKIKKEDSISDGWYKGRTIILKKLY